LIFFSCYNLLVVFCRTHV